MSAEGGIPAFLLYVIILGRGIANLGDSAVTPKRDRLLGYSPWRLKLASQPIL